MAHSSPYGPAGGDLAGSFPNPSIGSGGLVAAQVFGPRRTVAQAASTVLLAPGLLSQITSISLTAVARTALYVVPPGYEAVIVGCEVHCTTANAITVGPSCELGVSAGDIFASNATGLTTSGYTFSFLNSGMQRRAQAGETISFGVGTAATGSVEVATVDLLGYLLPKALVPLQALDLTNLQALDGSTLYLQ